MAKIHKLEVQIEIKCPADKFYGLVKNNISSLPSIAPKHVKSIQVLEGDGKSVGTVRLWKYVIGGSPTVLETKEKIEGIDDGNKSITFKVIDGHPMNVYKSFIAKLQVKGKADGSSVKWIVEFEKVSEEVPNPDPLLDLAAKLTVALVDYLAKA